MQKQEQKQLINNRCRNPQIYTLFLQKRYAKCRALIQSCEMDEFKAYISSLIEKNEFHLTQSSELLNECHIMNKFNVNYLKAIAKNFFLLGKYKSSLEVAKDAYQHNSADYEIFYILAKISLAMNDYKAGVDNFKHSILKEPNEPSYLQLGKAYMDKGEFVQAIETLSQCVKQGEKYFSFTPDNPEAYELLALAYSKIGKMIQAKSTYKLALEKEALRYHSLLGLGAIEIDSNEIQEAMSHFKAAYKANSTSAALWNNIGVMMWKMKKLIAAYSCFKRALYLDSFRWDIHANIALIFISKEKYLPAVIHLKSAIKLNKDSTLLNLLGVCLTELKDYTNSEKAFLEGLKMESNNDTIKYNLLLCMLSQNEKERAKQYYETLSLEANDTDVRGRLIRMRESVI